MARWIIEQFDSGEIRVIYENLMEKDDAGAYKQQECARYTPEDRLDLDGILKIIMAQGDPWALDYFDIRLHGQRAIYQMARTSAVA